MASTRTLSSLEAFGYEYGSILQCSVYLLVAQLVYVFLLAICIPLPGAPAFWLFSMYFLASIITVAADIHFFQGSLPETILPHHVRSCVDFAIFYVTSDFLLLGDNASTQKARKIAHNFVDKLGGTVSAIFFVPAMFLANCACIALFRLIINLILTIVLMIRNVFEYMGPQGSSSRSSSSSEMVSPNS